MDVFQLRDRVIADYRDYATSFVQISDERIREHVERELDAGLLWPEPLIQLNPTFEVGGTIDDLVARGVLHPECSRIFRHKPDPDDPDPDLPPEGRPIRLHRHQVEAIEAARAGANYVLTTGTGSGKSLTYIVPIVDDALRNPGRGVKAIVVYPMNALANSQVHELEKFLTYGYPGRRGPVRFARYTGQESEEEREAIIADPPDIILTNYVMLELVLTRPRERRLVEAARGLRFLVLDELHTYRGRQGADVALLCRRVKEACEAEHLRYIGTSATMTADPARPFEEQRREVAQVATRIFGAEVRPEHVIGETLRRLTPPDDLADPAFVERLRARVLSDEPPPERFEDFVADPLSSWIESAFGLRAESGTGRLVRRKPRPITGPEGAAEELARTLDVPVDRAAGAIRRQLLAGYRAQDPDTGFRAFPFRLHQFVSRGETVYATLEAPDERFVTTQGQRFAPGDRSRVLLPLAFCRECGKEYYTVWLRGTAPSRSVSERELRDLQGDDGEEPGFLYVGLGEEAWPTETERMLERLPEDWLEADGSLKRSRRGDLPRPVRFAPDGTESEEGIDAWFVGAPFRFCLRCGVAFAGRTRSDLGKLTTLGTGGRSTATTILSLAVIRGLRNDPDLPARARKLLSFTDNRQDASLQAGHFNDFVQSSLLRAALYKAAREEPEGLTHDVLAQRVFDAMALPLELYAVDPGVRFAALEETNRAFRNLIGYRLYQDLKRGWRITSPNLEECGLLVIGYRSLEELAAAEDVWADAHPALRAASPEDRAKVAKVLLDHMRRELAIKVDYLEPRFQDSLRQQSSAKLIPPWALDEDERLETAAVLYPRSRRNGDYQGNLYLSGRSGFGQYLRRPGTLPGAGRLTVEDSERIIRDLLACLKEAGLVEVVDPPGRDAHVPGYQLPAAAMVWRASDGSTGFHDPIRVPRAPQAGRRTNPFFLRLYRAIADEAKGLEAREHTAQVRSDVREDREERFREARLPVLFCSPTMELGIDIAELNVVNMRNVPPTPANYAQRSGRAGRSGQPAFVFTYCATGSPHDQYYFRRQEQMVSGQVRPPRLDLANEDLLRAHVHAIWLSEVGINLGTSLKDILDVEGEAPSLALQPWVADQIAQEGAKRRAAERAARVLATLEGELTTAPWYTPEWVETVVAQAPRAFDEACERWRTLYRAARRQWDAQNRVIGDATKSQQEKEQARRLRREAEAQLDLLTSETNGSPLYSDFYSYRYFASEGFLPGYSFPRLPLSAFIPGRISRRKDAEGDFISRPRFLAISEFGPRTFVYHEGSVYQIERAILPVDAAGRDGTLALGAAKWCRACGYVHPLGDGPGPDLCDRCGERLGETLTNLFRLQNVVTRRRQRINSDEEERVRLGFDVRTAFRFTAPGGRPASRRATVELGDRPLATLTYSDAATLWRVNLGWRRRTRAGKRGFAIDPQTGRWERNELVDEDRDPLVPARTVVIPYVEDRRNCLLFEPAGRLDAATLASLQAALKRGIGERYQLEDAELAAEPLPAPDDRRAILLYEAAEGGAGVLRRLVDDPAALAEVAATALELCHFDTATLEDLRLPPGGRHECEAACYDCLMSYTNQPDHPLLDRQLVRDVLDELRRAAVRPAPTEVPREVHLERLKRLCRSDLERAWLDLLEERNLTLPTFTQRIVEECSAEPDFLYPAQMAAIYIDGPHHDHPERHRRDEDKQRCLEDLGYLVIRFHHRDDWEEILRRYPSVFGGEP
ncbi:MAG TPA: DEAD/DEAH box helicase [Actinomycetota bacterium]|nr:DEAD/DEAH box helicase [Actinomycetota bacterium]